ncbi:MAG TPA: N-acetylmuramoyl-L-alanine amidase [Gemmatimonadaceae bacterium]|nr:N-acetylmuramoyl-L-alanine amidase [Gemmatimonadaceae bacterium]
MPRLVARTALAAALAAACASPPPPPAAAPAPVPAPVAPPKRPEAASRPVLPPVPAVDGPLDIKVVYPERRQFITSRDSNFIFGSIGNGKATLTIDGQPARVYPNGAFMAWVANPPFDAPRYSLEAVLGADTVRTTQEVRVRDPHPAPTRTDSVKAGIDSASGVVIVAAPRPAFSDTDDVISGRPRANETYHWFLMPGTRLERTGTFNGFTRVRLDSGLQVWLLSSDVRAADSTQRVTTRVAGDARIVSAVEWADFVLPMPERPAYFVDEGDHTLTLTLYGTRGNTDLVHYATDDSLIRRVQWEQVSDDRARYTLHLSSAPFGYLVLWEPGRLVLRVRRPPVVDAAHPLRGITVAVDAGHPPIGARGPTGLWEPDATLPIAERLQRMLEADGAHVVMTRTSPDPVTLQERPVIARRDDAQAFVSIHLNAWPDGVNPFTTPAGTATYFYYGQSEPMARAVQQRLVRNLGLPDDGIYFRSLAVVRGTWMPSILCEGAFVIMPDQEAALRTPQFQEAYARGILQGLEAYFRGFARDTHAGGGTR